MRIPSEDYEGIAMTAINGYSLKKEGHDRINDGKTSDREDGGFLSMTMKHGG